MIRISFSFVSIFLLALNHESSAQNERFIVNVNEFNSRDLSVSRFRCSGTIITNRHVLTTAACATAEPGWTLSIGVVKIFVSEDEDAASVLNGE